MAKLIYEGKAKQMWSTDDPEVLRVVYMDQATALNGKKKDQINGKGIVNNEISSLIFQYLMKKGIETHFIKKLSETEELVKKVEIVPLETPVEETYYKSDELDDPFINESQSLALKIVKKEELDAMWDISRRVNEILTALFDRMGLILVDFKLEFGRLSNGRIVLADEFSPDNCRLWDKQTRAHMDKDVYRRDLGDLTSVYEEVLRRLKNELSKEEA